MKQLSFIEASLPNLIETAACLLKEQLFQTLLMESCYFESVKLNIRGNADAFFTDFVSFLFLLVNPPRFKSKFLRFSLFWLYA